MVGSVMLQCFGPFDDHMDPWGAKYDILSGKMEVGIKLFGNVGGHVRHAEKP